MNSNPNFRTFEELADDKAPSIQSDIGTDDFPSVLVILNEHRVAHLPADATYFGFSIKPCFVDRSVRINHGGVQLPAESAFAVRGPATVIGGSGFAVARRDYIGFETFVGPIEHAGRLRYIDGCTDSLLISPARFGDPCLNLLYFPQNIKQTSHTHPSNRIGMVISGRGRCVTPHGEVALLPGVVFNIPRDSEHCFFTDDDEMRVVAWHPDSDFGPRDEDHPMLNRTIVNGISAGQKRRSDIAVETMIGVSKKPETAINEP